MNVVAYADGTNFYFRPVRASARDVVHICKGPFVEPVVVPSVEVDGPDTLVPDASSPVDLVGWRPTQMLAASIWLGADSLTEELLLNYPRGYRL